jgi:Fic family protein
MELPLFSSISFDQVSTELIGDAVQLAKKVNAFRPLKEELLHKVQKDLLGERVYNSNAIEGSTLSLRETQLVLEAGAAIDVGRKREAQEALNLGNAFGQMQELMDVAQSEVGEQRFRKLHQTLFTGVNDGIAGVYRYQQVLIPGAKHQPPDDSQVANLMNQFFVQLEAASIVSESAIQVATWAHWCIARIHPFFDGNGRMARLWQDWVLFRGRLTAALIRQTERSRYYDALTSADDGDFNPLAQLVAQSVVTTLQLYVNAFSEADFIQGWARKLVDESDARNEEQRKMEYIRWKLRMEELLDAFERCATQITKASAGEIEVQLKPYEIIDQPTWDSLRSGEGASKTWYFWLNCRRGTTRRQYCFFFGKHLWSPADEKLGHIPPSVCLLISEQQERGEAVRLDMIDESPLSLREILVIDNQLTCRRIDASGHAKLEHRIEAVNIAQSFLQDVILKRLA